MNIDSLSFSSSQFLSLIESQGLTGTWGWRFASNEHVWSLGLFRVLGLDPQTTRPSYDLLIGLVHPEDRDRVETCADIVRGVALTSHTFRIRRPDGAVRILSTRSETCLTPDGRIQGAAGVILDVTDEERLKEFHAAEQRRRRVLFNHLRTLTFSTDPDRTFTFPQEAFELTGLSSAEIAADPFLTIVSEEREYWRERSVEAMQAEAVHSSTPLLHIAGGNRERFEVFTVPVRDTHGNVRDWCSLTRPIGSRTPPVSDVFLEGLEQLITEHHLRAARALLDWSMTDFSKAAGLSLSTVRRMEESVNGVALRSRHKAVDTLRRFGICFSLMEGGVVWVGYNRTAMRLT